MEKEKNSSGALRDLETLRLIFFFTIQKEMSFPKHKVDCENSLLPFLYDSNQEAAVGKSFTFRLTIDSYQINKKIKDQMEY